MCLGFGEVLALNSQILVVSFPVAVVKRSEKSSSREKGLVLVPGETPSLWESEGGGAPAAHRWTGKAGRRSVEEKECGGGEKRGEQGKPP